ncbi:TM0106 family RecB-like putative nuclease [Cellulomonas hominis]
MFLLDDGTLVHSASDLADAAVCELAVVRELDAKLGRLPAVEAAEDAMLARAASLGDVHEQRVLADYVARFGPWDPATGRGVAQIERPAHEDRASRAALEAKRAETLTVLRSGADVVFQAGFFDGRFGGWADFIVREGDGRYAVYDSKLARHARPTALLQLAAYADQLRAAGITVADRVHLILGDRTTTSHRLADLLPVYRERGARLQRMLDEHRAGPVTAAWGDPRYRACGRCEVCAPGVEAARDVLLVAGLRTTQRARLAAAGVTTIDALAAGDGPVEGIGLGTLDRLRAQARLQVLQDPPAGVGARPSLGDAVRTVGGVVYELLGPDAIRALPPADPGDIFFDFEGDPLWAGPAGPGDWGLEYLFGVVEASSTPGTAPPFRPFWAHDRAQEKQALVDFLAYVTQRRERFPGMHVYHYAPYERTALLRLAGRHGVGEATVDRLLREGVLVDLYATVRASLRTGQRSASLKQLEPLYMDTARTGDVTTAGDSIVEYAQACEVRDAGDDDEWRRRLAQIADYNAYDCLSTLRLRDWLLAQVPGAGAGAGPAPVADGPVGPVVDPDDVREPLVDTLLALADGGVAGRTAADRSPDEQAVAMVAAALGYQQREEKPFWWAHYDRLVADPTDWSDTRSTFLVDEATVVEPWHVPPRARTDRRRLRLSGRLEPGSDLRPGAKVWALYDPPLPDGARTSVDGLRGWTQGVTVREVTSEQVDGVVRDVVVVDDQLRAADPRHDEAPFALVPGSPPPTEGITAAIRAVAAEVAAAGPGALPDQPALDLLRRVAPRTRSGRGLPGSGQAQDAGDLGAAADLTAALLDLDGSYLAVQGPPGTGKTFTGARVVADLVARGWRVGVVAQSHAVVEHMLTALAAAGVPVGQLGKKPAQGSTPRGDAPWRWLTSDADIAAFHRGQGGGYVLGGTAWDLTNPRRLPDRPLDLLVVDEAGQFSLAHTLAVSRAARNLLLLGDPQQLPQVSQGRHPEPVDTSALGWLADGHGTLPPELGYFLAQTWRMHPALCAPVSTLAYEGRLRSVPTTAERDLDGVAPGVRCVRVEHTGNAVASPEEAAEVVAQVRAMVGRRWRDPAAGVDRPLAPDDVLVVAAYNAQVWTVQRALDAAGLGGAQVGTVDRFQGREAPVVILTTAASAPEDVPRGMEFLLDRHRLNVAVSRGQWCAVIVRSAGLTDYLPTTPDRLEELGAFIGLCTDASTASATATPTA